MRRAAILWLFLMLAIWPAQARPDSAGNEIRALLDAQVAAWNRGDLDAFMETYWKSPQTVFVGSGGVFRGWEAVLGRYKRTYPDRAAMGKTTFTGLEVTLLAPDAAVVLGRWHLERAEGRLGGVFTLVLRKFPEGWRIILDHTSAMNPPPSE